MSKELIVSQKDFSEVGINAQLSVNDLVEVVAHDIYDKFMAALNDNQKRSKDLMLKWKQLFDDELDVMKKQLIRLGHLSNDEEITTSFGKDKTYWNSGMCVKYISIEEKDKGARVTINDKYFSYPEGTRVKVKLQISVSDYDNDKNINSENITGTVEIRTNKIFYKTILVSGKRFSNIVKLTKENNLEVEELHKSLPSGLLSVERFTREARVKMNKKIISSQSIDFRNKMSELFKIKL